MNASQAKAIVFEKHPPEMPSEAILDSIKVAASTGRRSIQGAGIDLLTDRERWWLEENGYTVLTEEIKIAGGRVITRIEIEW